MVAIIDYGMGNVASVSNALRHLGADTCVTDDAAVIDTADRIILPGVGAFGDGMMNIRKRGLETILREQVLEKGKLFLGICLGMQLICTESAEFGRHEGLGWINASVRQLPLDKCSRVPHIGWNDIAIACPNPLITLKSITDYYFVHSYYVDCHDPSDVIATCEYGIPIVAAIGRGRIFGTQFHPEKSQTAGLALLSNFLAL